MGAAAGKVQGGMPTGQEQGYMNALRQQMQAPTGKPGAVRLAGNSPTAPSLPSREEFDAYRKLKETATGARATSEQRGPVAPPRQGITMGPGIANRSF